jgi:hypothetical protein
MVSFRREKKRRLMQERMAAEAARTQDEATAAEGVRVTDRRRVSLDDSEEGVSVQGKRRV